MFWVVSFKLSHLIILSKFSCNYSRSYPVYLRFLSFLFPFFIFILWTLYIIVSQIHSYPRLFTPKCSNSLLFFSRKTTFWMPTRPWLKLVNTSGKLTPSNFSSVNYMTPTFSLNNTMPIFPCLIPVGKKNNLRRFFF